jgi:hypothetical protein
MSSKAERRAYGSLRDIVEKQGGTMVYQREGYQYGAWVISLHGKTAVIEASGYRAFPKLDSLYIPKVDKPKTWNDYSNDLIDGAEQKLLALLA